MLDVQHEIDPEEQTRINQPAPSCHPTYWREPAFFLFETAKLKVSYRVKVCDHCNSMMGFAQFYRSVYSATLVKRKESVSSAKVMSTFRRKQSLGNSIPSGAKFNTALMPASII